MPRKPRTYDVRFGCDNCGHIALYQVPIRREITDYNRQDGNVSSYHQRNRDDDSLIFCDFCQMPYLKVLWWQDDTYPVKLMNEEASNV